MTWQRMKDSNPHEQSQSLVCYHYTNPLYFVSAHQRLRYYTKIGLFVKPFSQKNGGQI